jgi:hypothetical protein
MVVVYKAVKGSNNISQVPQKIETPSYPDKGVAYAGYSKTYLAEGQYRLNPQRKLDISNYIIFPVAGNAFTNTTSVKASTEAYYITNMHLSFKATAEDIIEITYGGKILWIIVIPIGISNHVLKLDVPVKIEGNVLRFGYYNGYAINDIAALNFYGWIE